MKNQKLKIKNFQKGMATFELLIAMALMVAIITSVIPLVSGGQNIF